MSDSEQLIIQLKSLIESSKEIVVFTGAGISTESGIRDYRSMGGIWEQFQPVTIQEFMADPDKRKLYWERKCALYEENKDAKPNVGHEGIAQLNALGKLKVLVTQNIDGLHQMAGVPSEKVLELHGTAREIICLTCRDLQPFEQVYLRLKDGGSVPLCPKCGGFLKPNTISFGQNLNPEVLNSAFDAAHHCDLMMVLGSSLVVEPAASIPLEAKRHGARLVINTKSETPLDHIADIKIEDAIGLTLEKLLSR